MLITFEYFTFIVESSFLYFYNKKFMKRKSDIYNHLNILIIIYLKINNNAA